MTTETTDSSKDLKFDHWCIVELMGHQRIAGKVTEQNVFGTALMRVDVPAVDGREGFTKFYGASAIYAITPVEEDVARHLASAYNTRPVEEWRLQRLIAPPPPAPDEFDFDDDQFTDEDDEPHPTAEDIDAQDAEEIQWNANRAADMFGHDGIDEDGNPYVELQ